MIGIDIWNGSTSQVQNYIQGSGRNITYPIAMNGGDLGSDWDLGRTSFVIVDANGIIKFVTPQSTTYTRRFSQYKDEMKDILDELIQAIEIESDPIHVPSHFDLYQNYPNPFNGSTVIRIKLPQGSANQLTDITVYDALGKEIKSLVSRKMSAGEYEFRWNAVDNNDQNVSAGVYFISLKSGINHLTRKMIYIP